MGDAALRKERLQKWSPLSMIGRCQLPCRHHQDDEEDEEDGVYDDDFDDYDNGDNDNCQ